MRQSRRLFPSGIALGLALCFIAGAGTAVARPPFGEPNPDGFRAVTGAAARDFRIPADVRLVSRWSDTRANLTFERYQQYAPGSGAHVDGGQLTVGRRGGRIELVVGAHYDLPPTANAVRLNPVAAAARAQRATAVTALLGRAAADAVTTPGELRLNPDTGRLFYRVASDAFSALVYADVDAATGEILNAWSGLDNANPGQGVGVKGDTKNLAGLTTQTDSGWQVHSSDGRNVTLDAQRGYRLWAPYVVPFNDSNNAWDAAYQRVAVDAQYYAARTDAWYEALGFDILELVPDPANPGGPPIRKCGMEALTHVVHYDDTPGDGSGYANAFWNPQRKLLVYGDGDGVTYGPFSGAQDIVSHELSHAVTTCRAPLTYYWASGALNEAFSDIVATAIEWQLVEPNSSGCRRLLGQAGCADWWIGEDSLVSGAEFGFRDMASPDRYSHWAVRYQGPMDNRGVHYNSMIPAHAFYLMSMGGRNARCVGPTDAKADCDVVVPAIGIDNAAHMFFNAWGTLPEDADYCDAQAATIAAAKTVFPDSNRHLASAVLGWAAVGPRKDGEPARIAGTIGTPCGGDLPALTLSARSVALAHGQTAQIDVTNLGPSEELSVEVDGPVTAELVNGDPNSVSVAVPDGTPAGAYPLIFTGTTESLTTTRYAIATVVVDGTPPTAGVNEIDLTGSGQISQSGTVQLQVEWAAADDLSGVADADLEWSTTGNEPWAVLSTTPPASGATSVLAGGSEYRFRVRATDGVGHQTLSTESGPWQIGRSQETAATFTKTWTNQAVADHWGGATRSSKVKGATAAFTFNGSSVQWITNRGPKRGRAKIYLDGVFVTGVDLYSRTVSNRQIGYTATGLTDGPHTLGIRVLATANRPRVDIDGFVVLGQN